MSSAFPQLVSWPSSQALPQRCRLHSSMSSPRFRQNSMMRLVRLRSLWNDPDSPCMLSIAIGALDAASLQARNRNSMHCLSFRICILISIKVQLHTSHNIDTRVPRCIHMYIWHVLTVSCSLHHCLHARYVYAVSGCDNHSEAPANISWLFASNAAQLTFAGVRLYTPMPA